jgi:hypothetical protein
MLPSTPGSSKWSLSIRFPHQKPVCTSSLPHTCHMPSPSHSPLRRHNHNIITEFLTSPLPYPVRYHVGKAQCRTLYVTMLGPHTAVPRTLPYWGSKLPYPVRYHVETARCRSLYVTMLGPHNAVPCTLPCWNSTLPYPVRYNTGRAHCNTLYVTIRGQHTAIPVRYHAGTAHCRTLYVTMLGQHTAIPCTLPYWDSTLPYPVRYHAGTTNILSLKARDKNHSKPGACVKANTAVTTGL